MSEKSNFSFYIANKIRYMTSDFSLHAIDDDAAANTAAIVVCPLAGIFDVFNDLC